MQCVCRVHIGAASREYSFFYKLNVFVFFASLVSPILSFIEAPTCARPFLGDEKESIELIGKSYALLAAPDMNTTYTLHAFFLRFAISPLSSLFETPTCKRPYTLIGNLAAIISVFFLNLQKQISKLLFVLILIHCNFWSFHR